MEHYEKVYVEMILRIDRDGGVRPLSLIWEDGMCYEVTRVLSSRMSPPAHVGGVLTRMYECEVNGQPRTIYVETQTNRWFVEKPIMSG